jgi:hypothetical protein
METYGARSYQDFYQPLCEFFGDGHLCGVTLIDKTMLMRKKSFSLEEHQDAKQKFKEGRHVKIIVTDESIAA